MKIYLVGGAVRDQLLGWPVKEKDWVVVGATAAEMVAQGYQQVGKDFPVFLHPKTKEEYALARQERKTGPGYTGFVVDASPHVTLEQDLLRRDLTINAMAKSLEGEMVDPYHGQRDLEHKILRHVSPAFVEDPVRILRVARFAARYAELGFKIAPETMELIKKMVAAKEVSALVAERVWKELERALTENHPEEFFSVLVEATVFPELFPTFSDPTVGVAALMAACRLSSLPRIRWAAFACGFSLKDLPLFYQRYRVPIAYRELSSLVVKYIGLYQEALALSAEKLMAFLQALDAFRREKRWMDFLLAAEAIMIARGEEKDQSLFLMKVYAAAKAVDTKELSSRALSGKEIGQAIYQERLKAITQALP